MSKKGENIYKRKDGRWEARYPKGYTESGSIRYGYCYGKTYREAKEKVIILKSSIGTNNCKSNSSPKKRLNEYCDEWLQLNRTKVKESTLVKYTTCINKHVKPVLGGYYVKSINSLIVEDFSHKLLSERGLSTKTVRDILSILKSIFKYISLEIPEISSVNIVYPKEKKTEMRVLSIEEQTLFTRYLVTEMNMSKFGVLLALMTGLRIGEVCALRWSDFSFDNMTINVKSTMQRLKNLDSTISSKTKIIISEPKSNTSCRVIPLTDKCAELCKKWYIPNSNAYILTGSNTIFIEPRTLQYRFEKYIKDCGLTDVHFHVLRHTFATRCVEVGFEIKSLSEVLGHSSPKVTLERYVHSSIELKRENMNKLVAIGY